MGANNSNGNGVPDAKFLEQLANSFFNALPGDQQNPASVTGLPGSAVSHNGTPKSVAGSGISPSALEHGAAFNIKTNFFFIRCIIDKIFFSEQ
jgi:hypothetical protein